LSEDLIKQSHVLESLRIFDVECSGILKNVKEKTKVMKERKSLLKKNHSKNMKLKEKDIRNFNKIEKSNKNKRKFAEKEKDFQVANLLLDCKNLEDRAKFSLVEIAGLERNLFSEYLLSLKQIFLLQRELFSTARISCSITRLDQILQNDRISVDAVSGVLSVSRNKSTTENEAGRDGTKSPAASTVEKPSECEWSQGSDRTSVMSESSSESLTVSLRKSGGRFSTVRRRSASPLRGQDYVAKPVPCSPPVIQPSDPLTSNIRWGNLKSCSQTEDFDDDYEVSFYMNNMSYTEECLIMCFFSRLVETADTSVLTD